MPTCLISYFDRLDGTEEPNDAVNVKRKLEQQYQKIETEAFIFFPHTYKFFTKSIMSYLVASYCLLFPWQFLTTFSVVEGIKKHFCKQEEDSR